MKKLKDNQGILFIIGGIIVGCLALVGSNWNFSNQNDFSSGIYITMGLFEFVGFPMSIFLIVLGNWKLDHEVNPIITAGIVIIVESILFLFLAITHTDKPPNPPILNGVWNFTITITQTGFVR